MKLHQEHRKIVQHCTNIHSFLNKTFTLLLPLLRAEAERNLNELVRRAEATSKSIEERLLQLSINPIYNG